MKSNNIPTWLPQMLAPIPYVKNQLNKYGVDYKLVQINPTHLKPMQPMVDSEKITYFNNKINNSEQLDPIFISKDNKILDGHHRMISCFKNNVPILCIKLYLDFPDAARMLNKVQDRYNWDNGMDDKQYFKITDILSAYNDNSEFITEPEPTIEVTDGDIKTENEIIEDELINSTEEESEKTTLVGYRIKPINKNNKSGDIFSLEPKEMFKHRYELEFDNLLTVDEENIKDMKLPSETLALEWFPETNLKLMAIEDNINYETFINKLVCEKAKEMGYDGINYGNKILQAIK
jgi:hypothetical protein